MTAVDTGDHQAVRSPWPPYLDETRAAREYVSLRPSWKEKSDMPGSARVEADLRYVGSMRT
jgi:hypothetical protein